uniref:Coatomer subunit delta n=1 Tax=Grammatophora oceanica TaxID=210454 RepID=A0A7S1Y850_9STRA
MVVLSASVCTKSGKALVSRQFVEMNRLRVEGLLAAFPKLVGHASKTQHTFVETDSVRYVYQPLENHMYLLLITTKGSNIVEDLGTLRLLAKVIPDVAGGFQETAINDHAFDLIFAFDEVLNAGGYKEECTLSSIKTNLEMDSHEEKVAEALRKSKEDNARAEMMQREKDLREAQMAQLRQNLMNGQGLSGITNAAQPGKMAGFGGGGGVSMQGFGSGDGGYDASQYQAPAPAPVAPPPPKVVAKGMKLGGMGSAGKKDSLMAAMAAEDNLFGGKASAADFGLGLAAPAPAAVAAPSTPLTLALEEKITVSMTREGTVEKCEVKGTLTLTANTDAGTHALVAVNKAQLKSMASDWTFATHPKMDKKTYEKEGTLKVKKGGFPMGRGLGILRWSYNGEEAAPLTLNCWPEDEGGSMNVSMELELARPDAVLKDVNILLPLGTTDPPVVESMDGVYKHDPTSGMMCWHFDQVDANTNSTANMEFSIAGSNADAFFPIQIGFRSEALQCPILVTNVTHSENGTVIPNQMTQIFHPDSYTCA